MRAAGRAVPRLAPLLIAAGLILAAASVAVGVEGRGHPVDRGAVPTSTTSAAAPATVSPAAPAARAAAVAPDVGSLPSGIAIAQLGVHAAVVPVAVGSDGALAVPADVHTVGWWVGGALPGAATGTVVLDGHVDSAAAGAGALFDLRRLQVGAVLVVTGSPTTSRYRVTGLREYDKADLPSTSLFAQTGPARLVLVTCGGPFDAATGHYRDNVVAFAVPAPA